MKIGVIMPHRGDRDVFLEQFHRSLKKQTLQPHVVHIIDYKPKSDDVDITPRYRTGYDLCRNKGLDVIAFMEIDDYYHPTYLEQMAGAWIRNNKPTVFGTNYTIYYHIGLKQYFRFEHYRRSSMMSTFLKPDLNINWPNDIDPYTDLHIWKQFKDIAIEKGVNQSTSWMTFQPKKPICVGIKHGIGKCGGRMHTDHLHKYVNHDPELKYLKGIVDSESMDFYHSLLFSDEFYWK